MLLTQKSDLLSVIPARHIVHKYLSMRKLCEKREPGELTDCQNKKSHINKINADYHDSVFNSLIFSPISTLGRYWCDCPSSILVHIHASVFFYRCLKRKIFWYLPYKLASKDSRNIVNLVAVKLVKMVQDHHIWLMVMVYVSRFTHHRCSHLLRLHTPVRYDDLSYPTYRFLTRPYHYILVP